MSSPYEHIIVQYAEEAAFLWAQRASVTPDEASDIDTRLRAHLDGLRYSNDSAMRVCRELIEKSGEEDFFPLAVLLFDAHNDEALEELLTFAVATENGLQELEMIAAWIGTPKSEETLSIVRNNLDNRGESNSPTKNASKIEKE